jgi:hypothetical protein
MVITALFLIIPLVIYAYFDEIRQTLNGKLCIAFLVTQLYVFFIMPLERFRNYRFSMFFIFFIGAFSSVFVVNLMCFDIYLTLKHFREPQYQSNYFKKFVCFLLIFFVAAMLLTFLSSERHRVEEIGDIFPLAATGLLFTFFLTCAMNIFALTASLYYLIALTRSTTLSDNTRFDVEKKR